MFGGKSCERERMAEKPSTSGLHEEQLQCQFCWRGSEVEDIAGKLHAEQSETSSKLVSAHHKCMQYASALTQYKFTLFGGFDIYDVEREIQRGSKLRCFICKGEKGKGKRATGAVCGCAVKSCRKTFHFVCAFQNDTAVTKRLVVSHKHDKKYVLYRVFCSAAHEAAFRENLKEELRKKKKWNDSSSGDDDAGTTPDSKSASASNSFNTSYIEVRSPGFSSPGTDRVMQAVPAPQDSQQIDDTVTSGNSDGSDAVNNDVENCEESDPTVSSSSVPASTHKSKERRKSGLVQNRSRLSKSHCSQPPLCSPIAEESDQNQSGESASAAKAKGPSMDSQLHKNVAVVLEDVGNIVYDRTEMEISMDHMGAAGIKSAGKSVHSGSVRNAKILSPVNGLSVPGSPPKDASHALAKTPPKASPGRPATASDMPFGGQLSSPSRHASHKSSPARSSPRAMSLSPNRRSLRIGPHTDAPAMSPSKNSAQSKKQGEKQKISPLKNAVQSQNAASASVIGDGAPVVVFEVNAQEVPEMCASDSIVSSNGSNSDIPAVTGSDPTSRHSIQPSRSTSAESPSNLPASGPLCSDLSDPTDLSVSESGDDYTADSRGRKRKLVTSPHEHENSETTGKVARQSDEDPWQACVILLIPATPSSCDADSAQRSVASLMGVKTEEVWTWQKLHPDGDTVLPAEGRGYFALDVVKALEKGDSSLLHALLFDGEHLAKRRELYKQQALMVKNLGDTEAETAMQGALLDCVERKVKVMLPTPSNKFQAARLLRIQDSALLALDMRVCDQDRGIRARICAHKGLYRWTETTVTEAFPRLSMDSRHRLAEIESLTLSVWFQDVCQVKEMLVYPQDDHLLDTTVPDFANNLSAFITAMKKKLEPSVEDAAEAGGRVRRHSPSLKTPVLLVFQPVDFEVVNFQRYFQKSVNCYLQERVDGSPLLALVPATNLHSVTAEALSALVSGLHGMDQGLKVEIFSAFSPALEPVSLVVLKISAEAEQPQRGAADVGASSRTGAVQKRRGRPPKKKTV